MFTLLVFTSSRLFSSALSASSFSLSNFLLVGLLRPCLFDSPADSHACGTNLGPIHLISTSKAHPEVTCATKRTPSHPLSLSLLEEKQLRKREKSGAQTFALHMTVAEIKRSFSHCMPQDNRLQSGDHILQIGDVNLRGMGSEQVAAVLRQSGTHVRLVVARPVEPTSPDYQVRLFFASRDPPRSIAANCARLVFYLRPIQRG